MNKLMVPEFKRWVFYQLNESNKETPGMRPIYNQSFQEDPGIRKQEQLDQDRTEIHKEGKQEAEFPLT